MAEETTNTEILEAINAFSTKMDGRFDNLEEDVGILKIDVSDLKRDVSTIQSTMVTETYLNKKLAEHHGQIVELISREDTRFSALMKALFEKKVLNEQEVKHILAMGPFSQFSG